MGTRCLTVIEDCDGKEIAVLYRQFDGYIEHGHGDELKSFLRGKVLTNGFSMSDVEDSKSGKTTVANGPEDLAAQLVAHFKGSSPIGGIYLYAAGTRDIGEEFIYHVRPSHSWNGMEGRGRIVCVVEWIHDYEEIKTEDGKTEHKRIWKRKTLCGWPDRRG